MFFCGKIFAQIRYDSAKISPGKLPQPPRKIYTEKDFIYEQPLKEPNFFERVLAWLWRKFAEFMNRIFDWDLSAETPTGRQMLWISLTILLIVLIVIGFLFFWKKFRKTLGRNDKDRLTAEEAERNINEVDFDKLILTALNEKKFRLAIRFYYLKILKFLSNKGFIAYEYQKTNHEYFYEIQNPKIQTLFKEISFIFDYCWYGEYNADERDFIFAKQKYEEIINAAI